VYKSSGTKWSLCEKLAKGDRHAECKRDGAKEKIRLAQDDLQGEDSIAELCRREGIAQRLYKAGPRKP